MKKILLWNKDIFHFEMWETILSKNLTWTWISVYSSDFNNFAWWKTDNNKKVFKKWIIVIWARWTIWSIKRPTEDIFTATQTTMICKILNKNIISSDFLYYFLLWLNFDNIKSGTTIPMLTIRNIHTVEIPLFSLLTQIKITQEIEKQFSRLDEWLNSLKRTKENLKKYKASVLKSAVEWKLTKTWREQIKDSETSSEWQIEPASVLLEKILKEKEEKFKKEFLKRKYKKPEEIKKEDIPDIELPEKWCWSKVDYITKKQEYWSSSKASKEWDIPVLRMWNIQDWKLDFSDLKYFEKDNPDLKKLVLEDKDLLFCRTNGSPELVWKSAIYFKHKYLFPCSFAWYLIRVQIFHEFSDIEFLYYCLVSPFWRNYINKVKSSINQNNVSWEKLSNFIFPLPPLQEQNQIVKIVEEKLSVVEKLEKIVEENIKRAENLKQSILKKAFEWRLVEVWENEDEEVEKLLEEIKLEKAKIEKEEKEAKKMARKRKSN